MRIKTSYDQNKQEKKNQREHYDSSFLPPWCSAVQMTSFNVVKSSRNLLCLVKLERFERTLACDLNGCSQFNLPKQQR